MAECCAPAKQPEAPASLEAEPAVVEMLPDGSNPENVDPSPPLGWADKSALTNVKFYGVCASPPCSKIRTYFAYYNIEYEMVEGMNKPGSDYKKMPVLDVNGRQVNDSYIILKNVCKALTGEFDEAWEEKLTYEYIISLENGMSDDEIKDWAFGPGKQGFGVPIPGCMRYLLGGTIVSTVRANIEKAKDPEINPYSGPKVKTVPIVDILKEFKAAKGSNKFFKGDSISQVDLSLYGPSAPFLVNGIKYVTGAFEEAELQDWLAAMKEAVPLEKLFGDGAGPAERSC